MAGQFEVVGIRHMPPQPMQKRVYDRKKPILSVVILILIVTGCLACGLFITKDPAYLDLQNYNVPPNKDFLFGTDMMGRDIFSMIWYGGRVSLFIGVVSTVVSTVIAITFGAFSGSAPAWADTLLMRITEILLSVPGLLVVVFIQAILGNASVVSISIVIGITSWMGIAQIIRTEVRQIRNSGYVIASKCMGGSFFHILWRHLAPNFVSSVMFMVVMNVRNAIVTESTLSFMGLGLPIEVISWGSMLSLAEKALLTNSWWMIVIPGVFLVVTLSCITNLGNYLRKNVNRRERNI